MLKFLGAIFAIWLSFWPASYWLFGLMGLREETKRLELSFAFSFPVGLGILSYIVWLGMIVGLKMLHFWALWLILILMASVSWGAWGKKIFAALSRNRSNILSLIAVFSIVTAIWWAIRIADNQMVIQIGEHMMNIAFIQVMIKYQQSPPPNPFFAGFRVDFYYYFFALFLAILTVISNLPAHMAYFIAGTIWPGIVGLEIYVLLQLWALKRLTSLLGLIFYLFIGNLGILPQVLAEASQLFEKGHFNFPPTSELWWLLPTRIIPDSNPYGAAITEFPFFSFEIGDLHPHVVAIPWSILGLTLLLASELKNWKQIFLTSFFLGIIAPLNFWTVIPLWALLGLRFTCTQEGLKDLIKPPLIVVLAFLLFLPFHLELKSPIVAYRIGLFPTQWWNWSLHWGPFLLPLIAGLALKFLKKTYYLPFILGGLIIGFITKAWIFAGLATLFLMIIIFLHKDEFKPWAALLAGWILVNLIPEVFYAEDYWGGRYNTIFKLYFEGWLMISLALPLMLEEVPRWVKVISNLWAGTGLIYTIAFLAFITPNLPNLAKGLNFYWLPSNYFDPYRWPLLSALSRYPAVSYILEAKTEYPIGPVLTGLIELAQHDMVLPLWYPGRISTVGKNLVARDWFFKTWDNEERARILREYPIDAVIISHEERWLYGPDLDFNLSTLLSPALSHGYAIAYRNFAPEILLDLKDPIVFKGGNFELKLGALRITKGMDFDNKPLLALFEIWELIEGDPAAISFYAHFLDNQGNLVAQGDHPLGLWGTRWVDTRATFSRKLIYSVHWIYPPPNVQITHVRIGLWLPQTGQHIPAVTIKQGLEGPNGSVVLRFHYP